MAVVDIHVDFAEPEGLPETPCPRPAARIKPVPGGSFGPISLSAAGGGRHAPTSGGGPVWLELYLEIEEVSEKEDRTAYEWFEGSLSPWDDLPRPVVAWDAAATTLLAFGLEAPDPATADASGTSDATRALALLPHLYSLGTNRVVDELVRKGRKASINDVEVEAKARESTPHGWWARFARAHQNGFHAAAAAGPSRNGSAAVPIELFPLIGFHPRREKSRRPRFSILRTNVAVIGETIVTIRLPDLRCPPRRRKGEPQLRQAQRRTRRRLYIPPRFFPCWDATARDFADEIARHQAATGRALSDKVREAMELCTNDESGGRRVPDEEKLRRLVHLGEVVEMADRQLSRVLRRLGSYGEGGGDGRASRGLSDLSNVSRRYHYAVDEIRALEKEVDSARDRLRTQVETRFQATVAFAGSAILIPTLVAGIFGANVWLPGATHTEGLFALLLFIVAFAIVGGLVIHLIRARRVRPAGWKQLLLVGIVLASLAGAIVILALAA